jgi:hypothetical protein
VLAVPAILLINEHWPYRYKNVKPLLENVFASQVTIARYHRTYFPRPGFVATGLTLRRKTADGSLPPLGTAHNLIVQGGWLDLLMFRSRVELVDVEGLHITVPPSGSPARKADFPQGSSADFTGPQTAIGKLSLRSAVLEIQRQGGGSFIFPINKLIVHNMQQGQPLHYDVDMINATPRGRILAHGSFGPIDGKTLGNTPLSGDFTFEQVQLCNIGSMQGTLKSSGHFQNKLDEIQANATADVPQFAVGDGEPVPASANIRSVINGLNGDIVLQNLDVKMAATVVHAHGSISGEPKVTNIDFAVTRGRVEDLMRPFLHDRPPVAGPVILHAHAELLPGSDFLRRLHLNGSFDIPSERLTNHAEEQKLSAFSERAQTGPPKKDAEQAPDIEALSSLQGNVTIRDGIVSTPMLQFAVAGASVDFHGDYDLQTTSANLTGTLRMQSNISNVTTGWKSWLLKPFAPFFARKNAGAVVPVAVTGSKGNYKISSDLLHDK